MHRTTSALKGLLRLALLTATGLSFASNVASQVPPPPTIPNDSPAAQPPYPICQPPKSGEYLLLVKSSTPQSQEQVRRALPSSTRATICNYLDDVVIRVSGFTTIDTANAWARYLGESAGLSAFVARPSETQPSEDLPTSTPLVSTAPSQPTPSSKTPPKVTPSKPSTQALATSKVPETFNPKPLGAGYAVLVNHFNRPELALQVQQILSKEVGLVSYGQRPYLLAIYTPDQATAHTVLQKLVDRGFWAMVVDSRRVTLLRQSVNVQQSTAKSEKL